MPEVILPCRFCGQKYNEKAPMLYVESVDCEEDGCVVVCKNCGARGPVSYVGDDPTPPEIEKAESAAIAAWNALPRALTWTHEPPKVAGWYWMRQQGESFDLMQHYSQADIDRGFDNEMRLKQWAGPIAPPVEG